MGCRTRKLLARFLLAADQELGQRAWPRTGRWTKRPRFLRFHEIWRGLGEADWLEAFKSHPRIGESRAEEVSPAQSSAWSAQEQQKAATADEAVKMALKWGNREYEQKFGRIFIVCATGKSASEILEILRRRLHNDDATELQLAAEEQRQIMHIRLKKWIAG